MALATLPSVPAGTLIFGNPDVDIWRGTNRPRPIWVFEMNLAGSVMRLDVRWGGGGFGLSSTEEASPYGTLDLLALHEIDAISPAPVDPLHRDVVRWSHSDATVAAMPLGRIARGRLYRTVPNAGGERRLYRDFFFFVRA